MGTYGVELTKIKTKGKAQAVYIYFYDYVTANNKEELIKETLKKYKNRELELLDTENSKEKTYDFIEVPESETIRTDYRFIFYNDNTDCPVCKDGNNLINAYSFKDGIERNCIHPVEPFNIT